MHRGVVGLTCLSNLPGLVNAGSRISGKFVAAIRIIPYRRQVNALGQEQVESATHQPMTEEKKNLFFFLPRSAQNHPSQQGADAMSSSYALPIAFWWTRLRLFHQ